MGSRASRRRRSFLFPLAVVIQILAIVHFAPRNKGNRTYSGEQTNADQHARRRLIAGISSFVGIDCGSGDTDYKDVSTGFEYVSDKLQNSGTSYPISEEFTSPTLWPQLKNVRSFPPVNNGNNNCYTLTPSQARGNKFLIRAIFMYGNYDSINQLPQFELYVDVNKWEDVKFDNASDVVIKEIIHKPATDYIHICVVNIGKGTPFISALELIQLDNAIYRAKSGSLLLIARLDVGAPPESNGILIRYKDDFYGRIWKPMKFWQQNASFIKENIRENAFQVSPTVMSTAGEPDRGSSSAIVPPVDPNQYFYWYMHFVEVENLEKQIDMRKFNIYLNGTIFETISPSEQTYTASSREPVRGDFLTFQFEKTLDSTLPPILNAIEVYMVKDFQWPPSAQGDVDAIIGIKERYGIKKNWQGDPCMPKEFLWDGLECIYDSRNGAGIISVVNLSSSGLSNDIHSSFSGLSSLQHLDLSNNSLTGRIPDFLANMQSLKSLNLSGNNFTGSIPHSLIERNISGKLTLSVDGNPGLCLSASCNPNDTIKPSTYILMSGLLFLVVLLVVTAIFIWKFIRRRQEMIAEPGQETSLRSNTPTSEVIAEPRQETSLRSNTPTSEIAESSQRRSRRSKGQIFTYAGIVRITDFQQILGRGGSAIVYLGYLDGSRVAVKELSRSIHRLQEFETEVDLLMRIHHKNLVNLIGYCNEEANLVLVCEYMSKGNLKKLLEEGSLTWEERLLVALGAAQGLYYLHNDCNPRIIHRDMKTSNILVNEKLEAKISDFGISKVLAIDNQTHTTTGFAGTPGYLDPEYHHTLRLNEKSDVYSFGIVLFELITGQTAIIKNNSDESILIGKWVESKMLKGDIHEIMDPRLQGEFDAQSAWNLYEIAWACIPETAIQRIDLTDVLKKLKESLAMMRTHGRGTGMKENKGKKPNLSLELGPASRMARSLTDPNLSLKGDSDGEMARHTQ